jgi:predicted dinucleotide-binding enzyme
MLSSRDISKVKKWAEEFNNKGYKAYGGTFSMAAKFGEITINCTTGAHSIEALTTAGADNLKGKILIDLANPLDFSKGMPPSLTVANTNSLGEEIQKMLPNTKVVKTLNTINAKLMVNPEILSGEHDLFICGNDKASKDWVKEELLTKSFGWTNIIDLGDITYSRAMEMYLILWVRLYNIMESPLFNIHIVKKT